MSDLYTKRQRCQGLPGNQEMLKKLGLRGKNGIGRIPISKPEGTMLSVPFLKAKNGDLLRHHLLKT
jgi:hypothetical protein